MYAAASCDEVGIVEICAADLSLHVCRWTLKFNELPTLKSLLLVLQDWSRQTEQVYARRFRTTYSPLTHMNSKSKADLMFTPVVLARVVVCFVVKQCMGHINIILPRNYK